MAKSKADTFEGLGAEAAAPVKRVRASNKAKTFGQILGNAIDEFAAMDPAVREKVLATLNAQYPAKIVNGIGDRYVSPEYTGAQG